MEENFSQIYYFLKRKTFNALIWAYWRNSRKFLLIFVGVSIANVGIHIAWF